MDMKHFAHEHTLIFDETKEIQRRCCKACGLYVLSSRCYMCTTQDCSFYLHQACAELPKESYHYFHGGSYYDIFEKHALALLAKPREGNCLCGKCGKWCENFTYHCHLCDFVLHPMCGFPLDIHVKHMSHPEHPIVLMCREASLLCNGCGRKHEGYFYSCHKCSFWIHQDCALLPSFALVEKHEHHLALIYSPLTLSDLVFESNKCLLCSNSVITDFGLYCCFTCGVSTHVGCALSHVKDSGAIYHLPTVSSCRMHAFIKERALQESNSSDVLEKYHPHSLVLIDDIADQESVCNACIQPVSPPYYRFSDQSNCSFVLHIYCKDLPLRIKNSFFYPSRPGTLVSPKLDEFFTLFRCVSCNKYCNGFGYSYSEYYSSVDDIECSSAPTVIKHDSHKGHPLILTDTDLFSSWLACCGKKCRYAYLCAICKFKVHIGCALLPKSVTHKFDKHPLFLTFPSSSQDQKDSTDHLFCELCEEDIDSKYWFYHCTECDQSVHVDCIPSQGKFSKIKFGGTVKLHCHDHPLTLVRTLTIGSQTCGYCDDIIQGFKDAMALHCEDCDFWIHYKCGIRSWGSRPSHPYLDLRWLKFD